MKDVSGGSWDIGDTEPGLEMLFEAQRDESSAGLPPSSHAPPPCPGAVPPLAGCWRAKEPGK